MADVSPKFPLVQFPFSTGIDEGTRDEVVEAGAAWLVLENGRQDKRGGYSTRPGFTALTTTHVDATSPTSGYKMFADRDTTVRICDGKAEVRSATLNRWQVLNRVPEAMCRLVDVPSAGATSHFEDVLYVNGYLVLSWLSLTTSAAGSAYVAILDEATGAVVRAPELIGTSTDPRSPLLATHGTYVVVTRRNTAGTSIEAWYLDTATAASINAGWVAFAAPLATDANGALQHAVHSLPSTNRLALLYENNSGGLSRLTLVYFNPASEVIGTQTIDTNTVTPTAYGLGGLASDTLWVVWNEATLVRARGQDPTTVTTTLATKATIMTMTTGCNLVYVTASATAAGKARIVANDSALAPCMQMRGLQTSVGVAATDGAQNTVAAAQMIRKGLHYGGRYYGVFSDPSVSQSTAVVCDFTDDVTHVRPVACPAPGLSAPGAMGQGGFVASATTGVYYVNLNVKRSGVADGSALVRLDFLSPRRWQTAPFGNSTYLNGALPSCYDGTRIAEAGFLFRPQTPTCALSGTGITGTFRYVAAFEEIDADGNWDVSGLSTPSASTSPANQTVTITTQPLAMTARAGAAASARSLRVVWYRTLTGGVAPYYRLGTTINDTTATTATFTDTTSDTTLAANAKLYSQPGVIGTAQDHRPPPPFQCIASYNGMLVGASGSDVWWSGQNVYGEGVWFNPIFQVPIPGEGDITALWVQDGTLYVAKRREIHALSGEAPSDNGAGGLGLPRRLAVDLGCIESRSVCSTALGTLFQSDRGIEIFTRAQTVEWIGEAVQTTLASYPVVTSATVEPVSSCVYVELAASEASGLVSGNGRTLVYDLTLRAWVSADRRKNSAGTADAPSQSACMIYTGSVWRYGWMGANGTVYHEDSTDYLEADGSFIAKRAISANMKASGLQGLQHVNRTLVLAKYHTAHDLNLSFAYDYNSSFQTVRLYTAAQIATIISALPNMQLEHSMHDDARCQAVRVQLQDVTPSSGTLGTGQGATWVSLCFETVPQTGAYQLPDASR